MTSTSLTKVKKEFDRAPFFEYMLCIYHMVQFMKDYATIKVLLDSDSKVNSMPLAYKVKLDLKV